MPKWEGKAYWEEEEPRVVESAKNVVRWFPKAGKLQISTANWVDQNGEEHRGKTVTLDIEAMRESDDVLGMIEVLTEVINQLK